MLEKKPFQAYRLEEERNKDKRHIISVSLNEDEMKELMKSDRPVEEQMALWTKEFDKDRRSYYRLKKKVTSDINYDMPT